MQCRTSLLLQLVKKSGEVDAIIGVAIIGVRRGDRVGNAVRRRHAAHFDRHFPGFWAVVNFGQKVTVNVDHDELIRTHRDSRAGRPASTNTRVHPNPLIHLPSVGWAGRAVAQFPPSHAR